MGRIEVQPSLMSLPLAFNTTLETVPAARSYLRNNTASGPVRGSD
ncbi:MAG TPA: hypothetical protein VGC34_03915 [Steroidobacteraceae bacterium]